MIRLILPAIILASNATAQDRGLCRNVPYSEENCVRVLACIGDRGVFFDGNARGWDTGTVAGQMSDGTRCTGTWTAGGPLGTGIAQMSYSDGAVVDVVYYSQDSITGTVIGEGKDNLGRRIQVWSGENVLQFLTGDGAYGPALPCIKGDIPIS
ncbi:hypothetical protein [Yoonia sp. 2307UL14-13]|uniref:hypothetical protein n=1 Tax=Yoonia sp. 2307UL14-13 TaxID=3126506 RepID=UPI0030B7D5AD